VTVYGDDNENTAQLEDIFVGGDPGKSFLCAGLMFAFSQANPELLPVVEAQTKGVGCEELATVIFEKGGIPYINDEACSNDEDTWKKLNGDFARLVESVVYNREPY